MDLEIEIRKSAFRHQVWCFFRDQPGFIAGYIDRITYLPGKPWKFAMNDVTRYILGQENLTQIHKEAITYATTLNVAERLKS